MELQDITAGMGDNPTGDDASQTQSVTQADENATTTVATVDDVVEEKSETKVDDGTEEKTEASESKPETKSEEKVEDEDKLPFAERPGVKKRLEEIETKYSSKATFWDTIAEISQSDPEFRLVVVQRLENAGKLPKGTTENLKNQVARSQQEAQEESQFIEKLPPKVRESLKVAEEIARQKEQEEQQKAAEVEDFFQKFEANKPDIDKSANPGRVRNLIFNMASEMVERGQAKFEDAMEQAYKIVLHPESIAAKAKEDGQVEALVQANQEASSAITSGGNSSAKAVKLTPEEKRAAELIGITAEEYRKFKDSGDEIFENI